MRVLKWSEISLPGEEVNIAYATQAGADWRLHTHDFPEIFRVDSGRGLHMLGPGKEEYPLEHGHVVFIRPTDQHGFRPVAGSEPFAIVNVAFPPEAWNTLRNYYSLQRHPFFRETGKNPPVHAFRAEVDQRVADLFQGLLHAPRNGLTRDAFLLSLAQYMQGREADPLPGTLPAWLRQGILAFRHDSLYPAAGVSRLAEVCGCSPGHLARNLKSSLGMTPSEWLRHERMRRAHTLILSTDFSVSEVAVLSGFENLSHFHRCFRSAFGDTPLRYRKRHARRVV